MFNFVLVIFLSFYISLQGESFVVCSNKYVCISMRVTEFF